MNNQPKQSSFINTFAWIAIVFSGFGVLIGIMQNMMMMMTVMKDRGFAEEMSQNIPDDMPPMMAIMFGNIELIKDAFIATWSVSKVEFIILNNLFLYEYKS